MILTRPPYAYRATLIRVIDGDTYVLDLDLGFSIHTHATVRLLGWNCPELRTPEGTAAAAAATRLLSEATMILVQTEKDAQTFARWLAQVFVDGHELGLQLAVLGCAVPRQTHPDHRGSTP